jgi:3-oxoacyl-[acyl-carrier protein] reductase
MKNLEGKVALVTGASKGIGAAIARELAARGAAVAVNYSNSKAGADKVVADIKAGGGKAVAVQADLSNPDAIGPFVKSVASQLGPIDILVNNAGVYEMRPLEQVTLDHYHKQFDLNVLGLLLTTKEAVARFNRNGGSIINISSVAAEGFAGAAVYSATKGAVDAVSASLAQELGPKKIRVNSVSPGLVITEGVQAAGIVGSDFEKQAVERTPLGRAGQPQDIAAITAFLASDESTWVNGQIIQAAGGARP